MVRRTIAIVGAVVLIIILLVLGINGCLDSRKDRAFRDYAYDVRALVSGSTGPQQPLLRDCSRSPAARDALDVQTQVNAQRVGRRAARRAGARAPTIPTS